MCLADTECPAPDLCGSHWCPLLALTGLGTVGPATTPHWRQSPLDWQLASRSMDTETLDNTSTVLEEVEEPEEVSEQEELVDREKEAKEPEEEINEKEEEITAVEEEPRSERFKARDDMIVDIESASEDDADGDTDKPQEDPDHQSDSVKSEGGCQVSGPSPVVLYTLVTMMGDVLQI